MLSSTLSRLIMILPHETAGLCNEDMVKRIGNIFDAVIIASNRVRDLKRGDASRTPSRRGNVVKSIQEIEAGKVGREYFTKQHSVTNNSHHRGHR